MLKRKSFILLLVLSLIILTVGCSSSSSDSDNYVEDSAHGLKVAFDIPSELLADVGALTIEENTYITEAEVKLYRGEELIGSDTLEDPLENNETVFDSIKIGEQYEVQVKLKGSTRDQDGEVKTLYKGENTSSIVELDTITTVEVEVAPLNAESLKVNVDSNLDVTEVTLKHTVKGYEKILTYDYNNGVLFENRDDLNLIPARWSLIVKLEDRKFNIDEYGGREILLLPAEEKEVTLDINIDLEGDIDVEIIVSTSPDTPTGLRLDDSDNLIWDEQNNIKGYNIYRTETDNPDNIGLPVATVVEDNIYLDVEQGYYYWIRAYNDDGYSSKLSKSLLIGEEANKDKEDIEALIESELDNFEDELPEEIDGENVNLEFVKFDIVDYDIEKLDINDDPKFASLYPIDFTITLRDNDLDEEITLDRKNSLSIDYNDGEWKINSLIGPTHCSCWEDIYSNFDADNEEE